MFWAATRTRLCRQSSTAIFRDVKGGQTTTSGPGSSARGRNSARNASVSSLVLFIFQLAASSGVRSGIAQRLDTRQIPTLHQLERGPAAGRDPVDGIRQAELLKRRDRVAAARNRVAGRRRDRLGECS